MTDLRKAAEDLLEVVEAAIKAGDWKVDGACDLDLAIVRLRQALAQPEQEPVVGMFEEKLPDQNPPPWSRSYRLKRDWVGYTNEDRERIVPVLVQSLLNHDEKTMAMLLKAILIDIELQLKEKNT